MENEAAVLEGLKQEAAEGDRVAWLALADIIEETVQRSDALADAFRWAATNEPFCTRLDHSPVWYWLRSTVPTIILPHFDLKSWGFFGSYEAAWKYLAGAMQRAEEEVRKGK